MSTRPQQTQDMFVYEKPEQDAQRQKRLRVVTSCDSCRNRKVKCTQTPSGKCQACLDMGYECLYRDRENYYSQRRPSKERRSSGRRQSPRVSLTPSGASLSPTDEASSSLTLQPLQSMYSSATVLDGVGGSNGSPYHVDLALSPIDNLHAFPAFGFNDDVCGLATFDLSSTSSGSPPSMHSPAHSSGSSRGSPPAHARQTPQLFDPFMPKTPNMDLMPTLLRAFFASVGPTYPYLSHVELDQKMRINILSPALANAIASVAVRFCLGAPEFAGRDLGEVSAVYMAMAKDAVHDLINSSISLSGLHAIIVVAWASQYDPQQFRYYTNLALEVSQRFGINTPQGQAVLARGDPMQLPRVQSTWMAVMQLCSRCSQ